MLARGCHPSTAVQVAAHLPAARRASLTASIAPHLPPHRHSRPARVADRGRRVPPASEPQRIQQLARLAPDRAAQLPADDTARLEQQDGVPLPSGGFLEPCGEASTPSHAASHQLTPPRTSSRRLAPSHTILRHGLGSRKSVGLIAQRPRPQAQHSGLGARLGLRALGVPPLARPRRQRHPAGREGGARALGLAQVSGWGVYCCDFLRLLITSGVS